MAVVEFAQQRQGWEATETERGLMDTLVFRARTNSELDGPLDVMSYALAPKFGDAHPSYPLLKCNGRRCTRYPGSEKGALDWLLTCTYSDEVEFSSNPLTEVPRFTWESEQYQVPAVKDRNGKGVVNSAGDSFDPPPMKDKSRRIVTVTRNVVAVPTWLLTYEDAVNSDIFVVDGFVVGAGQAKCQRVNISERMQRDGIEYRTLTIEIHLSKDGWKIEPLDEGFRQINPENNTERIDIKDPQTGQKVTAPVQLDGAGAVLANPSLDNAVFGSYGVYTQLPFSALPLA